MVRYGLSDVPEVDVQPDSITCEKTKNLQASIKVSEYVRRMVFTLVGVSYIYIIYIYQDINYV